MKGQMKGNAFLMTTAIIWGTAFVAQKAGMDLLGPIAFNGIRTLIGGIALIPVILFMNRSKKEKELLGYIDYKDPELSTNYFVVTQLDTKYSTKFVAYCLNNGNTKEMRLRKKKTPNKFDRTKTFFVDQPFNDGDILYLKSWGKEPKMKKTENGWEKDNNTLVLWMYDYDIVKDL